jgi:hypothetical protein
MNREKNTTGIQADRDRNTKGQGHKWTGTQTDRDWDTVGQRQGHRRTGRGAGTKMDRKRERVTDGQRKGQGHRWTGTKADRDRNRDRHGQGQE